MDYQSMANEELEQYVANKDGVAICEMAARCLTGSKGMQQNYTRAYQLYHKGEKMGLKEAYLGLAQMYEQGVGMVRNPQLAATYYSMAGEDAGSVLSVQPSQVEIVTVKNLAERLNQVEEAKEEGHYSEAKKLLQQFFNLLSEIQSGQKSADAGVDVKMWLANAYWLLGHTSYLEKDYQNAEQYFRQQGVLEMYPWAAYLIATMHKMQGYSGSALQSDMELLQFARGNLQISDQEKGDVLGMMADLYLVNVGVEGGAGIRLAYDCYQEAAALGNYYAELQMEKFRVIPSGGIEYIGE